jgi:glycerophosphoryl diester phosphodiesterase
MEKRKLVSYQMAKSEFKYSKKLLTGFKPVLLSLLIYASITYALSRTKIPIVIGHRGSPAYRPEHTLESYLYAINLGANFIEPDLTFTKDGHLIARHENEISQTTNIKDFPEFLNRKTTKSIDGIEITGWFTEDFMLEEIKLLRCRERIPLIRPNNTIYNDLYSIPTFQEIINLSKNHTGIGLYPETKHPSYYKSLGYDFDVTLIEILKLNNLNSSPLVFIQSFEVSNLKRLRKITSVKLVQLLGWKGSQPFDFTLDGSNVTTDLMLEKGLGEMKTYVDIICPYKEWVIPRVGIKLGRPTDLVQRAHEVGLDVHLYTLRPENYFLPNECRREPVSDGRVRGDLVGEILEYFNAGVDGVFVDAPNYGREAVLRYINL